MCIWNCKVEDRHCDLCLYRGKCERVPVVNLEDNSAARKYVDAMNEIVGGDIRSRSRKQSLLWGRNFVAYKLRRDGYSLPRIGRILKRSHATIIHGLNAARNAMDYPKSYSDILNIWESFSEKLSLHKSITV